MEFYQITDCGELAVIENKVASLALCMDSDFELAKRQLLTPSQISHLSKCVIFCIFGSSHEAVENEVDAYLGNNTQDAFFPTVSDMNCIDVLESALAFNQANQIEAFILFSDKAECAIRIQDHIKNW